MVRELCDLHPLDMSSLSERVGLNKTAFSNFLMGRRPLPEKYAPQFLRQIGMTVKGELDPRHCFYFVVSPGVENLASKWIAKLFPSGGRMMRIIRRDTDTRDPHTGGEHVLGAVLSDGKYMAVIRDDVNFGNLSWIPCDWTSSSKLYAHDRLLDTVNLPTWATVNGLSDELVANTQHADVCGDAVSWADFQSFAEKGGLRAQDAMKLVKDSLAKRLPLP